MPYAPLCHHRRSIRLQGYDYTQAGAYFVTICVQGGEQRLGKIVEGEMLLNDAGWMVQTLWERLPEWFPTVELDAYVVMPSHFHAILVITDPVGAALVAAPVVATLPQITFPGGAHKGRPYDLPDENSPNQDRPALGDIVGAFKSLTTDAYIIGVYHAAWPPFYRRVWQRGYYEHIVRDERSLERIREYILTNPQHWELDRMNPQRQDEDDVERWLDLYVQRSGPV